MNFLGQGFQSLESITDRQTQTDATPHSRVVVTSPHCELIRNDVARFLCDSWAELLFSCMQHGAVYCNMLHLTLYDKSLLATRHVGLLQRAAAEWCWRVAALSMQSPTWPDRDHLPPRHLTHTLWFVCSWCSTVCFLSLSSSVASPGFVARRGKRGNYVMGHSRCPGAAAAGWQIVLWLMQYWSKERWDVDICTSWSRRLHNTWNSSLSDLLRSELKTKLLEVEGARAPVPHSWRRHCCPFLRLSRPTCACDWHGLFVEKCQQGSR